MWQNFVADSGPLSSACEDVCAQWWVMRGIWACIDPTADNAQKRFCNLGSDSLEQYKNLYYNHKEFRHCLSVPHPSFYACRGIIFWDVLQQALSATRKGHVAIITGGRPCPAFFWVLSITSPVFSHLSFSSNISFVSIFVDMHFCFWPWTTCFSVWFLHFRGECSQLKCYWKPRKPFGA